MDNDKNHVSIVLAVTLLISVSAPVMAQEAIELGTFENVEITFSPAVRFPGEAGLRQIIVSPAIVSTQQFITNSEYRSVASTSVPRVQILNVTLTATARADYQQINADGYYLEATMYLGGATRYELYLNGRYQTGGSCAGMGSATLQAVVADNRPAHWRVALYDNVTPAQGRPLEGNIYYN